MIIALTMWIVAVILGIADYKTEATRWAIALIFFAGLAGLGVFWGDNADLVIKSLGFLGLTANIHGIIEAVFSALSHYFMPYCALIFGLSYSEVLDVKRKKVIKILLLLPLIMTFLFFPRHDYNFKTSSQLMFYYGIFSIWAVPYLLISCTFVISSCLKETIPSLKRQRVICCLIAVPGMAFTATTTYLLGGLPTNGSWKYWRLNVIIAFYVLAIFLYNLFKYGVLGIKVRVEKQNLNNVMNVLNSGMRILSHSLKNEIIKISICMNNLQLALAQPDRDRNDVNENIQMVATSLEYLSNMVKGLQKNSLNPDNLKLSPNNLAQMIETALEAVAIFLKTKKIHLNKNVDPQVSVICDKVYLQEVFVNICQNAIEAMSVEGRLTIETKLTSKNLIIIIKDNGTGIAKENLPHVIEPFFTTKDRKNNLGLGLAYCYTMLKKHGATLEVQSERNIGTIISVFFPKNKIIIA